ncbi:uncharacterized protein [Ptychodera flava]|uniref:uncharacterized protein isoform X2 n=1 Tax=Ptychodera flava TaxID=63121 RepID=UPI00396AAD6A
MTDQAELEEARLPLNQQPRRVERKIRKPFKETKRRSIGGITRAFALSTSCHGIPRLAASKTVHRRSLWTLVIIIVLSGYVTHMSELLRTYFEYPVRTRIFKETNGSLQFPSVTICNANKVRLSELTKSSPYGAVVSELMLTIKREKGAAGRRRRKREDGSGWKAGDVGDGSHDCRVELGTDRRGIDVWSTDPTVRVNSSADCCLQCRQTPRCLTWTYERRGLIGFGNCWLSDKVTHPAQSDCCNSGIIDRSTQSTSIRHSGTAPSKKPKPEDLAPGCLIEQNIAISGTNGTVATFSANTSAECCAGCSATLGCLAWTFEKSDGICRLMDSLGHRKIANCCDAGELYVNSSQETVPSYSTSSPPKNVGICAVERNVDRVGFDLLVNATDNKRESAEDCCDACARTPGCVSWVFYKQLEYFGDCSLKFSVSDAKPSPCCDSGIVERGLSTSETVSEKTPGVSTTDEVVTTTTPGGSTTVLNVDTTTPAEVRSHTTEERTSPTREGVLPTRRTDAIPDYPNPYTYGPFEGYHVDTDYDYLGVDVELEEIEYLRDLFGGVVYDENVFSDFNETINLIKARAEFEETSAATELRDLLKGLSQDEIFEYGHQGGDMVLQCEYNGMPCNVSTDFMSFQDQQYGNCYTFTIDATAEQFPKAGINSGLKLTVFAEQDEYVGPVSPSAGFRVVVHSPQSMASPENEGVSVHPGTSTSLGVNLVSFARMNEPYNYCPDDENLQLFTEYIYTLKACQRECVETYLVDRCGCVDMVLDDFPKCHITFTNITQGTCTASSQTFGIVSLVCY